jgi:hypothetical protein
MRTCVRTYRPVGGGFKDDCELGCPAYDINDVTWRYINFFFFFFWLASGTNFYR